MQRPNFTALNPSAEALTSKPKMTLKTVELAQAYF